MARSSEVLKKIMRFKLQLSETTKPATVLKVLQKLKDLDVTLDILAESGIGKTVNSLRRHKQAGELAKSLVKGWKKLVPKQSMRCLPDTAFVKSAEDDQSCPENASLSNDDEQNDCFTSNSKNPDSSEDDSFILQSKQNDLEKGQNEEKGRKSKDNKNIKKSQQETLVQKDVMSKTEIQVDKSEKKKKQSETLLGSENKNGSPQNSRSNSREKLKSTNGSDKSALEQKSKSKSSNKSLMESKDSLSSSEKPFKKLEEAKDDRSSEISTSSEVQRRKRKKAEREKHDRVKHKPDSEDKERSKSKKAKMDQKDEESQSDPEERKTTLSFESYLNYDVKHFKRKDQSGLKKTPKIIKTVTKEQRKHPDMKHPKPPAPEEKPQASLMHLMDVPLPAALPELEKPSNVDYYFEKKAEREDDFCDEESMVFTGQRLNSKMQVYSGAKTRFLPAMISLYEQCIRTLQNNINLLYETGGVPFELLEPVLERCTPQQLLRIEEYNPIYMGLTDHLWGKHCQRDFKDCKLQEYESWKEMYLRVSEERERKLQRLTKSIVSAHSKKPKGRQVKMAFIHTVAKPPRDVRIQQEIHGTAVQQPQQLKCSVKGQENQIRPSCNERHEPNRSSSTSSGGSNTQDPRKKTRVAPMMAKSLKAFKKQLGRR